VTTRASRGSDLAGQALGYGIHLLRAAGDDAASAFVEEYEPWIERFAGVLDHHRRLAGAELTAVLTDSLSDAPQYRPILDATLLAGIWERALATAVEAATTPSDR